MAKHEHVARRSNAAAASASAGHLLLAADLHVDSESASADHDPSHRPALRVVSDHTNATGHETNRHQTSRHQTSRHEATGPETTKHQPHVGSEQKPTSASAQPGTHTDEDRHQTRMTALRKGAKTIASPVGIAGLAVETAWNAAHVALYPLGLLDRRSRRSTGYSTDELTPAQRAMVVGNVEAVETPIVLLHGMIDNRSIFTRLHKHLIKNGFSKVSTLNYSPFTTDLRNAARVLADHVAAVVEETGCERIHIVGHSLGGLIARYYVQKMGGDRHVDTLVTLGTPHQGTLAAHAWVGSLVKQLRPGSDLLAELESQEPDVPACQTNFVCYWSDLDHLVLPSRHGRITQPGLKVKNILVRGVGHMTLPVQSRVLRDVCKTLGQVHQPGESLPEYVEFTNSAPSTPIAEAS